MLLRLTIPAAMRFIPNEIPLHSVLVLALALVLGTGCERERIVDPGPDTIAPLPPAGLLVESARDGYIFISWIRNGEPDLRGYVIHRAEESDPALYARVDTVTQFYFIDEQRSYDTTYSYFVTALDESGNESAASDTVSARALNRYTPDPPSGFTVNGFNNGERLMMRLVWSAVNEADLATYRIYKSDTQFASVDPSLLLAEIDATFFDDLAVTQTGRRFFYAVTSVDRGGMESELSHVASDVVSSRPVPVSPMENGTAETYPLFRWQRASEAAEYMLSVSLSENTGEIWSRTMQPDDSDTLSFRYDGSPLTAGEMYFWRVSSVTAANGKPNGVSEARRFQVRN